MQGLGIHGLGLDLENLIADANVGYRKNYKSEKLELALSNKYKAFLSHFILCQKSKVKVHRFLKS